MDKLTYLVRVLDTEPVAVDGGSVKHHESELDRNEAIVKVLMADELDCIRMVENLEYFDSMEEMARKNGRAVINFDEGETLRIELVS